MIFPRPQVVLGLLVVLLAVVGLTFLALVASQQAFSDIDLQIARWVRSLDLPGLDAVFRAVNAFTDAHMAIALWMFAGAFFVLRGRPLEAIAIFLISGLWVGDALMSVLVDRPSPPPELVSVVEFSRSASFPSGHVTGAVSFYGLLTFLTLKNVRRGRFVTEFVAGVPPASNQEIDGTLTELYARFQEVGLPTWQIAPGNPHAYSNFVRTRQGGLKIIDLKSALVSPSYPWQELSGAVRDGNFPVFDDVDFVKLRGYVRNHAPALMQSLGRVGLAELEQAIEDAEQFTKIWKESEPRIWGRVARRLYRLLNPSTLFQGVRDRLDGAEAMATDFVSGAIGRWEREGQIDSVRAASLRHMTSTSEVQTLLKHLGAHLALTVAIAIPIPGLRSVARFMWTLTFRLKALYALGRGRMTRDEYQVARSIHSVPVMLLALVPALGALAYAASDTMVKRGLGRMLLDQSAHKVPLGLYSRLRLDRIIVPRSSQPVVGRRASMAGGELVGGFSPPDAVVKPIRIRIEEREYRVSRPVYEKGSR